MQRAITDIWRNLVRYPGRDNEANAEEPEEDDESESEDRDQEIEEIYKNLYWLRIVSLQSHQDGDIER